MTKETPAADIVDLLRKSGIEAMTADHGAVVIIADRSGETWRAWRVRVLPK